MNFSAFLDTGGYINILRFIWGKYKTAAVGFFHGIHNPLVPFGLTQSHTVFCWAFSSAQELHTWERILFFKLRRKMMTV